MSPQVGEQFLKNLLLLSSSVLKHNFYIFKGSNTNFLNFFKAKMKNGLINKIIQINRVATPQVSRLSQSQSESHVKMSVGIGFNATFMKQTMIDPFLPTISEFPVSLTLFHATIYLSRFQFCKYTPNIKAEN